MLSWADRVKIAPNGPTIDQTSQYESSPSSFDPGLYNGYDRPVSFVGGVWKEGEPIFNDSQEISDGKEYSERRGLYFGRGGRTDYGNREGYGENNGKGGHVGHYMPRGRGHTQFSDRKRFEDFSHRDDGHRKMQDDLTNFSRCQRRGSCYAGFQQEHHKFCDGRGDSKIRGCCKGNGDGEYKFTRGNPMVRITTKGNHTGRIQPKEFYDDNITNLVTSYKVNIEGDDSKQETRNGYIYIRYGVAHEDQLDDIIQQMYNDISDIAKKQNLPEIDRTYILNYVITSNYKSGDVNKFGKAGKVGYAYMWVKDPRAFNAFTGSNFDGTDRVITERDEDWVPPSEDFNSAIEKALKSVDDWGEQIEIADEIQKRYEAKVKVKQLPPLVTPKMYKYTDEQMDFLHLQAVRNKEPPETVPLYGSIILAKAWSYDNGKYTLFSGLVPLWVTEQDLYEHFSNYSTIPGYPKIELINKRSYNQAMVYYHQNSHDAGFALLMTRKIYIKNKETGGKSTLIFDFYRFKTS